MSIDATIGVIGGGGWLGGAIIEALLSTGALTPDRLVWSSRQRRPERWPSSAWTNDNQELTDRSDLIILSVRPADFRSIAVKTSGKAMISLMAGLSLQDIEQQTGSARIIRALPNSAAEVRKSYTPWFASSACSEADKHLAQQIFEACGASDQVPREQDIDYFAGPTGTGSAYPALLADALRKDAISHGIAPDIAERAVLNLLIGTGRLLEVRPRCPSNILDEYVNYRGMTAAALVTMQGLGIDKVVHSGVAAALARASELKAG